MLNVLFLCTGNSARSILAEALLNELGGGIYKAYSAGSHPAGQVNPGALQKLREEGLPVDGLASQSWDQYTGDAAPDLDIVITVCDNAAGETCPIWNGSPVVAHWEIPDPAAAPGDAARRQAFDRAYDQLKRRIEAFLQLPHQRRSPAEASQELQRVRDTLSQEEAANE